MASPIPKLITLEQYLSLPETKPATELIDGRLEQKPLGRYRHGRAQARFAQALGRQRSTRKGEAITELTVRFPASVERSEPDVSYWLPENLPDPDEDYPAIAPDLAVEVLSRDQSRTGLRDRFAFLRSTGTSCTLLVDPWKRTVEVHDGDVAWQATPGQSVTLRNLAGFTFRVRDLFD